MCTYIYVYVKVVIWAVSRTSGRNLIVKDKAIHKVCVTNLPWELSIILDSQLCS